MPTPKIPACPKCLGIELNFSPGGEFAAFTYFGIGPMGGKALCRNCQEMVLPVEFESVEDYRSAVEEFRKGNKD